MTDHPSIWLEPGEGDPDTGRSWCQDDVWSGDPNFVRDGPATRYVRADLVRNLLDAFESTCIGVGGSQTAFDNLEQVRVIREAIGVKP